MKKDLSQEDIVKYRSKLANPIYMKYAINKIAGDLINNISEKNIEDKQRNTVAEKNIREKKMKNRFVDLHDQLFDQISRLNTEISGDELTQEIKRAEAMSKIASQLISNGKLMLDYHTKKAAGELEEIEVLSEKPTKKMLVAKHG